MIAMIIRRKPRQFQKAETAVHGRQWLSDDEYERHEYYPTEASAVSES